MMDGLELVQLHVGISQLNKDTILARFGLLSLPEMDPGVAESVMTIIFAAPRIDIKEINMIRDQLTLKYGKEFSKACQENLNGCINPKIVHNLAVMRIEKALISGYLNQIADHYKINYVESVEIEPLT